MARVLVPLADGCEELEAVTIIDILRRADIRVVVAGLKAGPVKASRGVVITPDMTLDEALERDFDMIVLPGGLPGADHLNEDERIHDVVGERSHQTPLDPAHGRTGAGVAGATGSEQVYESTHTVVLPDRATEPDPVSPGAERR